MTMKEHYMQHPGLPTYASRAREWYGSVKALPPARSTTEPPPSRDRVKHINICGGFVICVGPWLLFTVTCWCFAFRMRYEHPWQSIFVAVCGAALVCMALGLALQARRRRALYPGTVQEATWNTLLFLTVLAAWLLGMGVGECMFQSTMKHYYDLSSLNFYAGVDVGKTSGSQLLDAGIITFAKDSHLDRTQAAGYGNGTMYCVAPIISPLPESSAKGGKGAKDDSTVSSGLASYDFWAVGTDCCNEGRFSCGAYDDPYTRAGLRSLSEELNSQYNLAVTIAVAKFGIAAPKTPIFLTWMQDPTATVSSYEDNTWQRYLMASIIFLVIQLFFVGLVLFSLMQLLPEGERCDSSVLACVHWMVTTMSNKYVLASFVVLVLYSLIKLNH